MKEKIKKALKVSIAHLKLEGLHQPASLCEEALTALEEIKVGGYTEEQMREYADKFSKRVIDSLREYEDETDSPILGNHTPDKFIEIFKEVDKYRIPPLPSPDGVEIRLPKHVDYQGEIPQREHYYNGFNAALDKVKEINPNINFKQ